MTNKPILFSAPMIRALLDGRKTQTRRTLKPQPKEPRDWGDGLWVDEARERSAPMISGEKQIVRYEIGDRLWVREAWGWDWYDDGQSRAWKNPVYRADNQKTPMDNGTPMPWKSSIHMPRRASRLTLIVTDVRVQRLWNISVPDCIAEGIDHDADESELALMKALADGDDRHKEKYADLWDCINGPGSWDANPYVVAYTFSVHKCNIDAMPVNP